MLSSLYRQVESLRTRTDTYFKRCLIRGRMRPGLHNRTPRGETLASLRTVIRPIESPALSWPQLFFFPTYLPTPAQVGLSLGGREWLVSRGHESAGMDPGLSILVTPLTAHRLQGSSRRGGVGRGKGEGGKVYGERRREGGREGGDGGGITWYAKCGASEERSADHQ